MTKPEDDMTYAVAMHGHASGREALIALKQRTDRAMSILELIERLASDHNEHPAKRCSTVVLLAQLGSYYVAGGSKEIAAAIEAFYPDRQ